MTKIYLGLMLIIITISPYMAIAANMCVKDDAVMVVLDPVIGGTSYGGDTASKTWSVTFPYGVISGIAGCSTEALSGSANMGKAAANQDISVYSTGGYCYCKMLYPIESKWVFVGGNFMNNAPAQCKDGCAVEGSTVSCAKLIRQQVDLRRGLFRTAGTI
jgi:hypothetical protein